MSVPNSSIVPMTYREHNEFVYAIVFDGHSWCVTCNDSLYHYADSFEGAVRYLHDLVGKVRIDVTVVTPR